MCTDDDLALSDFAEISVTDLRLAKEKHSQRNQQIDARVYLARQQYARFAGDAATARLLQTVSGQWWLPLDDKQPFRLLLNGRFYEVFLPSADGGWALQEILFLETYQHTPIPVDHIYDLGAFVGLSAIYFHSLYPDSHITCVEPAPANLAVLRRNLRCNVARHTVLPAAVADASDSLTLAISSAPSMTNSSRWSANGHTTQRVPSMPLMDIVSGGSYGIKMDIEGGEFDLASSASVLEQATWIMGELHFTERLRPEDVWLLNLLHTHFHLYHRSRDLTSPGPLISLHRSFLHSVAIDLWAHLLRRQRRLWALHDRHPMSRILLAITSCKKDALGGYNQAQRDTFLKGVSRYPNVMYRFFIGDGTPTRENEAAVRASVGGCYDLNRGIDYKNKCDESERSTGAWEYTNFKYDEVPLPVPDDYFHLVYKVRAIYRWALQFGFTHIFKCDTDTYVDIDRLMNSGFDKHDFTGGPAGSTSVAGGSGYWISRQSAQILADAPVTYWAEDGWVNGRLGKHGISLFTDHRYSDNLVSDNNDLVSTHLGFRPGYTIEMMYRVHRARIKVTAGVR